MKHFTASSSSTVRIPLRFRPVVGAAIAGFVHTSVLESPVEEPPVSGRVASYVHV